MPIRKEAYEADRTDSNAKEATQLMWWILEFVNEHKEVTADQIYEESECGDIAMYLALHHLVSNNMIFGTSPYDEKMKSTPHTEWVYKTNPNMAGLPEVAVLAKKWNPDEWH